MSQAPSASTPQNGTAARPKRERQGKPLPTGRIAFTKQIEILRAHAAICGSVPRPITNAEVGKVIGLKPDTVSMANPFFTAIGLLEKADRGYVPAPAVLSLNRAFEWDATTALQKLAPIIQQTWFAQAILPKLQMRPREEEEVVVDLGDVAEVGPDCKGQLALLLDYLEVSGLIARENGLVRATRPSVDSVEPHPTPSLAANGVHEAREDKTSTAAAPSLTSAFAKAASGGVQFGFNVNVDMREMGSWTPERISAFFGGIAAVLAAKGALEKQEGTSKTAG